MKHKAPQSASNRKARERVRWLAFMSTAVLAAFIVTVLLRPGHRRVAVDRSVASSVRPDSRFLAQQQQQQQLKDAEAIAAENAFNRAQLKGRPACVAGAVTGPSQVHGWVEKAGPLPMELLDGPRTPERHKAYFVWRDSTNTSLRMQTVEIDGTPVQVGRAPPLFPYCRVLVNHQYRTLYLKAPKTGSTSLLTLLGTCSGVSDKSTCFEPLQVTSREEYEQIFSDYFVFTVVRNPWVRAVSSYRMLARYTRRTCADIVGGWNKVCMDLNHLGRLHHEHAECTMHKQQGEGFSMHHLIAQAPCLITANGEWATDFVVRTENLEEDMKEVLKEMDSRRQPDAEPLDVDGILGQLTNVNKVHVACQGGLSTEIAAVSRRQLLGQEPLHLEAPESYCDEAQYFLGQHAQCFDALRAYYSQDMKLFSLPACPAT